LQGELGVGDIPELAEQVAAWVRSRASIKNREGCPWPFFVVAEKILSETEPLPLDWAVCGTTGYDFLASSNGLFVNPENAQAFTGIYEHFLGEVVDFDEMALATQRLIMDTALSSEINELSHEIERIGERNRHYRDFTLNNLRDAVSEVIACLPVYRTYINAETGYITDRDRNFIVRAVRRAARRRPDIDISVFNYIQDTLLLTNIDTFPAGAREALRHWVMKFQQMTGPVMAKGVEDTAFYRYNRLVALNEVGGHPVEFGTTVEAFHAANRLRAEHWPHSMLTTSTHDNKRSEDVRGRLDVLSELPAAWAAALTTWSEINGAARTQQEDATFAPDRNDEYLLYQTILGTWPLAASAAASFGPAEGAAGGEWGIIWPPSAGLVFDAYRDRVTTYMQKAVKEAKVHGSWINPDEAYDEALRNFVGRLLSPEPGNRFIETLAPLARRVAYFGQFNSLSQALLKLTSPGLPDIYQGNELWDFSLVDPDNRRPVDYDRRRRALADIRGREQAMTGSARTERAELAAELLAHSHDGRIKLYTIYRTLNYRRSHEAFFRDAAYVPLSAEGGRAAHVVAFGREVGQGQVIVVAPRLAATLAGDAERPPVGEEIWQDTRLMLPAAWRGAAYRNLFTDEIARGDANGEHPTLQLSTVLGRFPVAVLVPEA
jgi:(1->4)-alpha-D-glucan 1-alpha-D-glucosylmutase